MKSWISTRRPAWAPPRENLDLRGRQRDRPLVREPAPERQARRRCAPPRPPPSTRRCRHWRRGAICPRRRRARPAACRAASRSSTSDAPERRGDLALDRGHRLHHVEPARRPGRRRAGRAPRPSRWRPRPAPSPAPIAPARQMHFGFPPSAARANPRGRLPRTLSISNALMPPPRPPRLRRVRRGLPAAVAAGGRAKARGRAFSRSRCRYSTGDLPSRRASSRPGSSRAARSSSRRRRPVALDQRGEAGRDRRARAAAAMRSSAAYGSGRRRGRRPGSPNQAHSASRKTGPFGPARISLRADIAVDQRFARPGRRLREAGQRGRQVRVPLRRRQQVGLQPDRVEDRVRGEGRRGRPIAGIGAVDGREPAAPPSRAKAGSARPAASSAFQTGCVSGASHAMASAPAASSCPSRRGAASGSMGVDGREPARFRAVALHRRAPVRRNLEPGAARASRRRGPLPSPPGRCPRRRRPPAARSGAVPRRRQAPCVAAPRQAPRCPRLPASGARPPPSPVSFTGPGRPSGGPPIA